MAQHQEFKRKGDVLEQPEKHGTPLLLSTEVPKMCDLPNKSEPCRAMIGSQLTFFC